MNWHWESSILHLLQSLLYLSLPSLTFLQALNASFDLTDVCLWSAQIQIEFSPLLFTKDVKEQEKDVLCLDCMVLHSFVNGCGLERLVQ